VNFTNNVFLQIVIHKSLAIPGARGDGRFAEASMFARSNPCYFGHPWFSFVRIKGEATDQPTKNIYGQILLMFSAQFRGNVEELAVVRFK
jgi:hypothetical protein